MVHKKTLELIVDDALVKSFSVAAENICGIPADKGWRHHLGMREPGHDPRPIIVQVGGERAALRVPTCVLRNIREAMGWELDKPVEFRAAAYALHDQSRRPQKIEEVIIRLSQDGAVPKWFGSCLNP